MERAPFPEKIVSWFDIAKGLGEVALELVTKRFTTEPKPVMSEHYYGSQPEPEHTTNART